MDSLEGNGRKAGVSPQKIVDLKVIDRLEKMLNQDGLSLKGLQAEDFTPQAVADRIMGSVRQAYGQFRQSHPGHDDGEFFSKVREGLQRGFSEASDILQSLGVLQGQVAADVDKTIGLTMQGLQTLEAGEPQAVAEMAFQGVAMQSSRSLQLQIETQQGDLITLSLEQSTALNRSALQASQPGQYLNAFQEDATFRRELNISIEGDLNADEQKALSEVMQNMHKISNAFFHGNQKAALKHALNAGFDSEQIAGFSLDLSMQKSIQAVAAYRQTALPERNVDGDLLARAGEFLSGARSMLADAQAGLQQLSDPRQAFNDLFAGIGALDHDHDATSVAEADNGLFAGLIASLGQSVFAARQETQAV